LAMIASALGTFCNEVRDCAAAWEQGIGNPSIAASNDNSSTQIGIGALILIIRHTIPIAIGDAVRRKCTHVGRECHTLGHEWVVEALLRRKRDGTESRGVALVDSEELGIVNVRHPELVAGIERRCTYCTEVRA